MADAARDQHAAVIDLATYLRETIAEMDETIAKMESNIREWKGKRDSLAVRLAVIEASNDDQLRAAVEDYKDRVATNRPYESAEPAEKVLSEAWKRFGDRIT